MNSEYRCLKLTDSKNPSFIHYRSLQYIAETSSDFSLADRSLLILTMLEVATILMSYTQRIRSKKNNNQSSPIPL